MDVTVACMAVSNPSSERGVIGCCGLGHEGFEKDLYMVVELIRTFLPVYQNKLKGLVNL